MHFSVASLVWMVFSWKWNNYMVACSLLGFPHSSSGKESACSTGDLGSIPGLGRSPGEGKGYPLQYSGLENSRDHTVHGVTKSRTRLSDVHIHVHMLIIRFCPVHLTTIFWSSPLMIWGLNLGVLIGRNKNLRYILQLLYFLAQYLVQNGSVGSSLWLLIL